MSKWKLLNEIVRVGSEWVTLVGEHWLCDNGKELEYWRVEKADSVIVLPIQKDHMYCVNPTFRPGVQRYTVDFPGGRLLEGRQPHEMVPLLLRRELGISADAISCVKSLNADKWFINSSFSNQGLWGFVVEIDESFEIPESQVGVVARADEDGINDLMSKLDCLQCRTVLHEWQHREHSAHSTPKDPVTA